MQCERFWFGNYPVYPVCEKTGRLLGLLRGQMLFEAEAIALSAQAGEMVGVEGEERLTTPWVRSLRFRHPWLQVNLFCGLLAAHLSANQRCKRSVPIWLT